MSLLMDALRKAEQAKRNAEGVPNDTRVAETAATDAITPDPEVELELNEAYIDALDEAATGREPDPTPVRASLDKVTEGSPPAAVAPTPHAPASTPFVPPPAPPITRPISTEATPPRPAPAPEPTVSAAHQRWAARTVFVAKDQPSDRRRAVFYAAVGVLVLATVAVYLYVYFASMSDAATSLAAPVPSIPAPMALPASETAPAVPDETEERLAAPVTAPERAVDRDRATLAAEMAAAQEAPDATTIKVTRRALTPRTDKLIVDAYAAYQRGDTQTAHRIYWNTLRVDPNNRNALLGLAAISAKNGEQAQAREFYSRLLDRDPSDPLALAGLLNLEEPSDARAQESRVKLLLTQHPEAAHLHAALGNLYAHEQRWAEAQTAYAQALALDERDSLTPEQKNPDFAFNLAVSLEHLGQRAAALEHYREALAHATRRKPDFDPALAEARVRALSARAGP